MKLLLGLGLLLVTYSSICYYTSPVLEVEEISGHKVVISVDGKQTFRPLTLEDELDCRIIYIKGEK